MPSPAGAASSGLDEIDAAIVTFQAAYRAVVGQADELLAEQGLGRSHHKILFYAARHHRCSVTEVRDFIGVTRQALQRPLADLYRQGYIETVVSPLNRRVHQLVLTEAGADYERRVSALVRVHFEAAFGRMGEASTACWFETMRALADSAGASAVEDEDPAQD